MTPSYLNRYNFTDEDIVFEDNDYVIVDKSFGLAVYEAYCRTSKGLRELGTFESLESALDELIDSGSIDAGKFRDIMREESIE